MVMFILLFAASLVMFIVGLWRFPFGSFQNIICLLIAAAMMYSAMSMYVISSATPVTAVYPAENVINGNVIVQYPAYNTTTYSPVSSATALPGWEVVTAYCFTCVTFSLVGLLFRLTNRLS